MSAVLHSPFMSQTREPFAPAFTAVNGRTSPKDMTTDAIHVRSTLHTNEYQSDHKSTTSGGSDRKSAPRQPENGHGTVSHSISPTIASGGKSPHVLSKRRRSTADEGGDNRVYRARDESTVIAKPLFGPYPPANQVASPKPAYQTKVPSMDHPRDLTLPPIDRPEPERRWNTEPLEVPYKSFQPEPKPRRAMDLGDKTMPPMPSSHPPGSTTDKPNEFERESTMETTRAGVQVEMKKRKRQFANRTKTGCGTCRRRKKKCDEAKPECSNCTRGGFICEGYAKKQPWPTNGATKQAPTLLARERPEARPNIFGYCPACKHLHIPHCDFPCRTCGDEHFPHCGIGKEEANRTEPGVLAPSEIEKAQSVPANRASWSQPSQASYIEHSRPPPPPPPPPPTSYPQPPPNSNYERPPSLQPQAPTHDRQPSIQPPAASHERQPSHDYRPPHQHVEQSPSSRHPDPRIHHHTPKGLNQVPVNSPLVTTEPKLHLHMAHQPVHQPRQSSVITQSIPPPPPPPPPPPTHYAPPPRQKSEKEKMLDGEPFLPYNIQLTDERTQCTGAVYRFNSTSNAAVGIAQSERERYFKYIVGAGWIQPRQGERHISGHLGGSVHVATPFQCDYGYNISVGDYVVIGSNCEFHDSGRIAIGRNTKIGSRVTITTLRTPTDTKTLKGYNGTEIAKEVYIGENVHIGDGCIVEAGVRIGNGAIIRPGSVVVRDVPPDCIALGNPANVRDVNWVD